MTLKERKLELFLPVLRVVSNLISTYNQIFFMSKLTQLYFTYCRHENVEIVNIFKRTIGNESVR